MYNRYNPQTDHKPTRIFNNCCRHQRYSFQRSQRIPTLQPFPRSSSCIKPPTVFDTRPKKDASAKTEAVFVADSSLGENFELYIYICCEASKQQADLQTPNAFCDPSQTWSISLNITQDLHGCEVLKSPLLVLKSSFFLVKSPDFFDLTTRAWR